MPARPNAASTTSDRELTITRIFDAPRELVFRAWTEPAHLARWWGPRGYTLPSCQLDLRPGGAYSFEMHAPDGAIRIWHGVVREIVKPERIVWTCFIDDINGHVVSGETILRIDLEDYDGKTRLTLHQSVFQSVEVRDAHSEGWNGAFARLAEHLTTA